MSQEEADAQRASLEADGPLRVAEYMADGSEPTDARADIIQMMLTELLSSSEAVAMLVHALNEQLNGLGWLPALIENRDTKQLAFAWQKEGEQFSIPVFILPESLASRLRDL
jgi:hypothetical protein